MSKLPETLQKKMEIALSKVLPELGNKRFKWEKDADDANLYHLTGIDEAYDLAVTYRDAPDESGKMRKGFRVTSLAGKKVHQDTTLDVGIFCRPIKAAIREIVNPAPAEEKTSAKPKKPAKPAKS